MTSSVDSERLLKELRKLWLDLGKAAATEGGVLRACAMTLIVVADERHDAAAIGETLASIMHEHPSRAIVIRVRDCPERLLEARVFAQCWMPFGRRQQICCEQVEIITSPGSLADAAGIVRALIVPDLPAILYSPSENLWWMPTFSTLLPLAGRLVIDSCGMTQSTRALGFLSKLPATLRQRSDLVWTRLTPWREAVSQIFDDPRRARSVHSLSEIRILYKGHDEPSAVYYLAGWFMHVLGANLPLRIAQGVGYEYAGIGHVAIAAPTFSAEIDIVGPASAEIRIEGQPVQAAVWPVASDAWALRQELGITGRDRVFEDSAGLATLLWGAAS
ncbi:MAG TPA: glucose-6-phosphate dehydrogenase assembly protein OpcA [Bryobacteraceae bacterium]|nr:glucose-6-phosphate dehydrogenase assembly protein OpcA [Bryobacteraceae bacterium]